MPRMVSRPFTSTPEVGSSRNATSGAAASAKASETRCFSPPLSRRQVAVRRSARPTCCTSAAGSTPLPYSAQ